MNTIILKKLSMIYVKVLAEEETIQFYINKGWEFEEDMSSIRTRLSLYRLFVNHLKKLLNSCERN